MSKVTWCGCTDCGMWVKLNGAGSDANLFQRMVKATIGAINPVTTTLFRDATDHHDMCYHKGDIKGIGNALAQREADDDFLALMLHAIDNPQESSLNAINRWLVRSCKWYFKHKAYQYHWAVRTYGHVSFAKVPCTSVDRIFDPNECVVDLPDGAVIA